MQQPSSSSNEWQKQLDYYKNKLNELSGESIRFDYLLSSLRYELKQRKDGFSILSSLQKEFTVATPLKELFSETLRAINTHLGIDRSVILNYDPVTKVFQPAYHYGYPDDQWALVQNEELQITDDKLKEGSWFLLNKSIEPTTSLSNIREHFFINYFVGVPILQDQNIIAFLLAGRIFEKLPFNHPLNKADVDTFIAISSLLGSVLQNKNVAELREEMKKQKNENTLINRMLAELKATQAQLIQSEKMASLGELTAGIAHEIQNPLNFVNNFSELNKELIIELRETLEAGNSGQAMEIAQHLSENEDKILHHGKRADTIVKSMLQHSRTSSGKKEPADINELVDEYLRLAYHGWRAKEKSFNAKFVTEYDKTIQKIDIVPQDIARVVLNLVNNAFYAVNEKERKGAGDYEPTIHVTTTERSNRLVITIADNGKGIHPALVEKIFQPFFTTKPAGEGTGLGLSLAYDIVTKGHGGDLQVRTKEGEGTEFIITIPR